MQKLKINQQIKAREVRLIDDEGVIIGVVSLEDALKQAQSKNLDVIEVQPQARPPVAKLMDYAKYLYRLKKTARKQDKGKAGLLKGVRFGFKTSDNDLNIKAKKTRQFLEKGFKVRVQILLRGREKMFKEEVKEKIKIFLEAVAVPVAFDQEPMRNNFGYLFTLRLKIKT